MQQVQFSRECGCGDCDDVFRDLWYGIIKSENKQVDQMSVYGGLVHYDLLYSVFVKKLL